MRARGQTETLEQHIGALGDLLSTQPVIACGKDQDVPQRKIAVEVELLRREPDEPARKPPLAPVIVAEDANASAARLGQTDDCIDRRRFAGTVWPEETEEFAGLDPQRNSVDCRKVAVSLYEAIDLDGGRGSECRVRDYGIKCFNCLYRWRRRVAMSSALSGIPQSANWVATLFTSNGTRLCFTCQPPSRSVRIA